MGIGWPRAPERLPLDVWRGGSFLHRARRGHVNRISPVRCGAAGTPDRSSSRHLRVHRGPSARRSCELRRHDHRGHDARQRPRGLPEQRHRDRRRRITLDLNGHTVDGNGKLVKKCPKNQPCDLGLVNDGHDGVTVRNGSVRGFGTGVLVGGARQNRVLGIASSRNDFFGFVLAESARSLVRDSSGNNNPAPDGDGLGLFGSHDIRIVNNSFRRNAQTRHPHRRFHRQPDQGEPVLPQRRFRNPHGGRPQSSARQPLCSERRLHDRRPRQSKRDRPKPPLARRERHRHREGPGQPGRRQRRRSPPQAGYLSRAQRACHRRCRHRRPRKCGQRERRRCIHGQGGRRP